MFQFHSRRLWKMSPCQPSKPCLKPPANSADISSVGFGERWCCVGFGELRIGACLSGMPGVKAFPARLQALGRIVKRMQPLKWRSIRPDDGIAEAIPCYKTVLQNGDTKRPTRSGRVRLGDDKAVTEGRIYGSANVRFNGGGLGKPHRLRAPAPRTTGAREKSAEEVRDGRAPLFRHEQCALHHCDPHRYLGAGQGESFYASSAK